jgi:hypothetical protein
MLHKILKAHSLETPTPDMALSLKVEKNRFGMQCKLMQNGLNRIGARRVGIAQHPQPLRFAQLKAAQNIRAKPNINPVSDNSLFIVRKFQEQVMYGR